MQAPRRLQLRRGNTAAVSTYLGAPGELIINTDTNTLYVHNGATVGGIATTINTSAITSNISSLQTSVAVLQGNILTLESGITTLTSNAAVQAGLLATLLANAGVQSGDITALLANAGIQSSELATLTSNAAVQAGALSTLTANAASQSGALADLVANAAVQAGLIAGAVGTYSNSNVSAYLTTNLYTTETYVNNQIANISIPETYSNANVASYLTSEGYAKTSDITTANTALKGYVDGAVSTLTSNAAIQAGNIATLFSNAAVQAGSLADIYANLAVKSGEIADLQSNAASQSGILGTLTANAAVQAGLLDTLTGNAASQGGALASLVANAATQASELATLTSNAASQSGALADLVANAAVQAGLIANATGTYSNSNVAAYLTTNQYATETYVGAQIANISIPTTYSNSNVASYLPTYSGNIGNVQTTANVVTTGYFIGNGALLTGIVASAGTTYSNTNVASYLTSATITTSGNITAAYLSGNISITGNVTGTQPNVTIQAGSYNSIFDNQGNVILPNLAVSGNVISGGYFLGNGALLTGIVTGGGGTDYSNSNVSAYLISSNTTFIGDTGNVSTVYPVLSNIAQVFIGNNTSITSGNGWAKNATNLMWNMYFAANGAPLVRNTQAGAGMISLDLNGFTVAGNVASLTANANATLTNLLRITSAGAATFVGAVTAAGVTSTGTVAVNAATGITTNQATFLLANASATTINMGGAATTIRMGTNTSNVFVGRAIGNANRELLLRAQGTWNTAINIDSNGGFNSPPYTNQLVIGGSGTGMTANYNATGGYLTSVTIYNPGTGYQNGDVLSVPGGIAGNSFTLTNYSSTLTGNSSAVYTFGIEGTLTAPGNITIASNSSYFIGNTLGTTAAYTGNVTADYFVGNGALLTGIVSGGGSTYGDSNVASYLPTYTGNIGNIDLVANLGAVSGSIATLTSNAAVQAGIISNLTNYANANVASYLPTYSGNITAGNITATGNVSAAYFVTTGGYGNISQVDTITANNGVYSANVTVNGIGVTMPNRPAFRVIGNGGQITATANITSGNFTVDYNQGNYLTTSTGVFTAPVAGLYSVHLVVRTATNTNLTINQAAVLKNNANVMCMVEFGANTSMNHAGVSTIAQLAVGDVLTAKVLVGTISFDGNDNWSVAYIG